VYITASSFNLRSAPGNIAITLLDSNGRTLLTICAFNFADSAIGGIARLRVRHHLVEIHPRVCRQLFRDVELVSIDATFSLGVPSSFRNDFSPELELRTTSQG